MRHNADMLILLAVAYIAFKYSQIATQQTYRGFGLLFKLNRDIAMLMWQERL